MVDLTKIKQFSVVDQNGDWGYVAWDDTAAIRIDRGSFAGTIEHGGKTYTVQRVGAPAAAALPTTTPPPVVAPPAPAPTPTPPPTQPTVQPPAAQQQPPTPPPASPPSVITVAHFPDRQPFPWDKPYTGAVDGWDPARFNTGGGRASFDLTLKQSAPGVWVRFHSATDPAADPAKSGTGAVLRAPIQVSGAAPAGKLSVNATIPHGKEWFFADFDTDPAMPNPVRLSSRFGVGFNVGATGNSHAFRYASCAYIDGHAPDQNPKDFMTLNPFGVTMAPEQNGPGDGSWHLPGEPGSSVDSFYAAALLDYLVKITGGIVSFCSFAMNGGSTGNWQPNDPNGGHTFGQLAASLSHTSKTHGFVMIMTANDHSLFSGDHSASMLSRLIPAICKAGNNPDMVFSISASPLWDGGQDGFLEAWHACLTAERAFPGQVVVNRAFDAGGWWSESGHATQWSRSRYAVNQARDIAGLWGKARGGINLWCGPEIVSATRDGALIKAKVRHNGGSKLVTEGWQEGPSAKAMLRLDPSIPVAPEVLASIPDVFPAGTAYADYTSDKVTPVQARMAVASVQLVNNAPGDSEVWITLAKDPGDPSKVLDLYWGMGCIDGSSFNKLTGAPPGQWMLAVKDDVGDVVPYGRDLNRSVYPVAVIPVQATATTLAIDPPRDAVLGQHLRIGGTGSGAPADTLAVTLGGTISVTPDQLQIRHDNTWSGYVTMPGVPGAVPLSLPNGPTVTVNVRGPRDTLPASFRDQAAALYRADAGTFSDKAGTTPTQLMGSVKLWRDLLGGIGDLTTLGDDPDTGALLDLNKKSWANVSHGYFNDPRTFRASLNFEMVAAVGGGGRVLAARNPAIAASLQGDVTLVFVLDGNPDTGFSGWFQLGNTTDKWGWSDATMPGITIGGSGMPAVTRGVGPAATLTKSVWGPNYLVLRVNATTGRLRFKSRAEEITVTVPTATLAPFNSLMIGSIMWQNRMIPSWMRMSTFLAIGAELSDDQVNADLMNYLTAEWPY